MYIFGTQVVRKVDLESSTASGDPKVNAAKARNPMEDLKVCFCGVGASRGR